eukprot:10301124-Alexandrium_andersonii.AAC.1
MACLAAAGQRPHGRQRCLPRRRLPPQRRCWGSRAQHGPLPAAPPGPPVASVPQAGSPKPG